MSITFGIHDLPRLVDLDWPQFLYGVLWVHRGSATLYDEALDRAAAVADPLALAALRAALAPSEEHLGPALLQAWVRSGPAGPELRDVYWLALGDRGALHVSVRPVPPEHDAAR